MLSYEWSLALLLISSCYNAYQQYIIKEHEETIESYNDMVMSMAHELSELGSPNVTWSKPNEEG